MRRYKVLRKRIYFLEQKNDEKSNAKIEVLKAELEHIRTTCSHSEPSKKQTLKPTQIVYMPECKMIQTSISYRCVYCGLGLSMVLDEIPRDQWKA